MLKHFPPVSCMKYQDPPSVRFFILVYVPQWEAKIYALRSVTPALATHKISLTYTDFFTEDPA